MNGEWDMEFGIVSIMSCFMRRSILVGIFIRKPDDQVKGCINTYNYKNYLDESIVEQCANCRLTAHVLQPHASKKFPSGGYVLDFCLGEQLTAGRRSD